jgi:hypothetical protein
MIEFALGAILAVSSLQEFAWLELLLIVEEVIDNIVVINHFMQFFVGNLIKQAVVVLSSLSLGCIIFWYNFYVILINFIQQIVFYSLVNIVI